MIHESDVGGIAPKKVEVILLKSVKNDRVKDITLMVVFVVLFFVSFLPFSRGSAVTSVWSETVTLDTTYHWHVEKTNFQEYPEFEQSDLAGSDNVDGGDIAISIEGVYEASTSGSSPLMVQGRDIRALQAVSNETLPNDFDFINGDRLMLSVVIEGDMGKPVNNNQSRYHSDWHLFILPITVDGQNFFEILFNNVKLLENMTKGQLVDSSITASEARARFIFSNQLNVTYRWDVTTGLLQEKTVEAIDGGVLKVVPGEGTRFGLTPEGVPGYVLMSTVVAILFGVLPILKRHRTGK